MRTLTKPKRKPVTRACPAAVATRAECDRLRVALRDEKAKRRRAEKESDLLASDNARLEARALDLLDWVDTLTRQNERLQDAAYKQAMGG
jgi:acyl transferase domain-containing protein